MMRGRLNMRRLIDMTIGICMMNNVCHGQCEPNCELKYQNRPKQRDRYSPLNWPKL